ncbi:thioredoxin family protein [Bacillus sp. 1P06AnD]|uniref:thioredoxin family protein n=1 Tax=Bacillus sp. 1P06AnD TaxID=3132208 RepID=UPI0039A28E73
MKKIILFLVGIIVLFAAIFLVTNMAKDKETAKNASKSENSDLYQGKTLKNETAAQLDDPNYQNIILPDELEKKLASNDLTFVYFFSPICSHCVNATPKLMKAAKKEKVHINQFNLYEFEDGWDTYNIESTPTLSVFKDGKELDRLVGDTDEKTFTAFLKQYKE